MRAFRLSRLVPLVALVVAVPAAAQIQGLGYRLTPSVAYVRFDDAAGLSNGLLYGGGLGLSFGEFVELGGAYQRGSFTTDFSNLSGFGDRPTAAGLLVRRPTRSVGLQRYGGALKLNLLPATVVPFVTAGTGIVRIAPDEREATQSIYLLGGVGLQASAFDRFAFSVAAEDFAYRFNAGSALLTPDDLDAAGLTLASFDQVTAHNLGVHAAAHIYLGGRRPGDLSDIDREFRRQFSGGLSGLSLVVEPFYSRVTFNEAFAYRDQTFVGGEAGLDFGPLVGIRAFYGRGTGTTNPTDLDAIQMVGGDLRLRLSEGSGFVPFLSIGGGYLNVLGGYATEDGATPENGDAEDAPFAAVGAGLGVLISPRLRAVAEVRGLLMSTQDEADLSRPEDVYFSPMLRAGLALGIGGTAGRRVDVVRQSQLEAERAARAEERTRLEASLDSLRAELAALDARRAAEAEAAHRQETRLQTDLDAQIDSARAAGDSLAVARLEAERRRAEVLRQSEEEVRAEAPEHMVTIPLPREGELYVRYGPPGGVLIEAEETVTADEDLRTTVREALREALAERAPGAAALTEADLDRIEARVTERLAAQRPHRPPGLVTTDDLERMEQRLEERLLRALREALREQGATDAPPRN